MPILNLPAAITASHLARDEFVAVIARIEDLSTRITELNRATHNS
jgi:hypothetical protein